MAQSSEQSGSQNQAPQGQPPRIVDAASGDTSVALMPEAFALLDATFARSGPDLMLTSPAGDQVLVRGFFLADPPPALTMPSGATLSPEVAAQLAGPVAPAQYAQAEPSMGQAAIGIVDRLEGVVLVTRASGEREELRVGDRVFQGDVLETSDDGAIGIVLADETTFSMGPSGRMLLDEMIYDPSAGEGSLHFTAVRGVFTFVTGQIAKTNPDAMTVDTPVATIGIRGTQFGLDINEIGRALVVMMEEAGGVVGELIVRTEAGVAVLNIAGHSTTVASLTAAPAPITTIQDAALLETFAGSLRYLPLRYENENDYGLQSDDDHDDLTGLDPAAGPGEETGPTGTIKVVLDEYEPEAIVPQAIPGVDVGPDGDSDDDGAGNGDRDTDEEQIVEEETEEAIALLGDPTSTANQTLIGSDGPDTIAGGLGDDFIYPGDGDDLANAGAGNDQVVGGTGGGDDIFIGGPGVGDVISYPSSTSGVIVDLTANAPLLVTADLKADLGLSEAVGTTLMMGAAVDADPTNPWIDLDLLLGFEDVVGGSGGDHITGDAGANAISGLAGDDTLIGEGGDDDLVGGSGDDSLEGGEGDDNLVGGIGNDNLVGGAGIDVLVGGAGNDSLAGGGDGDLLLGGAGSNVLAGGDGFDVAQFVGLYDDFSFSFDVDGTLFVTRPDGGVDSLTGVEQLSFDENVDVDVAALGLPPGIDLTTPITGDEDQPIPIDLTVSVANPQEAVESVKIAGVPAGAVLSLGTLGADGVWTIEGDALANLPSLTLTPPTDFNGVLDPLTVTVTSTEVPTGGTPLTSTETFSVTVSPVNDGPVAVADTAGAGRGC